MGLGFRVWGLASGLEFISGVEFRLRGFEPRDPTTPYTLKQTYKKDPFMSVGIYSIVKSYYMDPSIS